MIRECFTKKARKIVDKINKQIKSNNSVINDIVLKNNKRLFYFSLCAIPVNLLSVILFATGNTSSINNDIKWHLGIITVHSIMLMLMVILGMMSFNFISKTKITLLMKIIQNTAVIVILTAGIGLTAVDQLITTSITPFILTCTIVSLVFLIRPYITFIIFLSSFCVFYFSISITQLNPDIVLSGRVNGLAAAGLGICLSLILWKSNVSNFIYKKLIEDQNIELEFKNQELKQIAFYDPMTNLYNRRKIDELIMDEIDQIKINKQETCLILVDLDHFKNINDNFGHQFGDIVLIQIASILLKNVRSTDSVSRWGGEEFLILLPRTSLSDGIQSAKKLRSIIESTDLINNNTKLNITASFGVAALNADSDNADNSLIIAYKNADKALYAAKSKGRNCVETVHYNNLS